MAEIILDIDNSNIPRIKEAFIKLLIEGDAVDLENPTNEEVLAKLKSYLTDRLRRVVLNYEKQKNQDEFIFNDLDVT